MINLCVLMEGAFVSRGGGFQMSLYGLKGTFIAVDAVMLDLSFGKTIRVILTMTGNGSIANTFHGVLYWTQSRHWKCCSTQLWRICTQ